MGILARRLVGDDDERPAAGGLFAVLDAAILAAPDTLTPIAPGAIVASLSGARAVVLAELPGACDLYLSDGVELRVERAGLLPVGKLPRISWVASQSQEGAWLAKFYQGDRETSRHFAVRRYGGLARALCAAVAATAEEWPDVG